MRLAENTGHKKSPKIRHLCTIAQVCRAISSQLRHLSTSGKNLSHSNISSTCLQNMVNFGPLTAEICWRVWFGVPQHILMDFTSWLRYCTGVTERKSTKLCTMFGHLLGWYTIYTFWGLLAPDGILPAAKLTLRPSSVFSYIGTVTARHSSSGRQPNFGVVQGMELQNFRRGRHLYSAGRPSRWASAHILVHVCGFRDRE